MQCSTPTDLDEKSICGGKGENVPEVTLAKHFPLKSLSDGIEGIKDKTLEADPNLEKSRTICQDKSSYSLCIIGYTIRRKWQALLNTPEIFFSEKKKKSTLILNISKACKFARV